MATKRKKSYKTASRRRKKSGGWRATAVGLMILVILSIYAAVKEHRGEENEYVMEGEAAELMNVVMPDSVPSQIVHYKGYTAAFNPRMHIPNWVAWELTGEETKGSTPRYDKFAQDPDVEGCAETYDYLYSGYDRGHMAPAGDMKWSEESMRESFFLTNICPQARELNTGSWRTLEEKCRQWAQADSAIIIIAGPVFNPAPKEFIGDNRVAVPQSFFKVVLAPYAQPIRAIGFIMPNGRVAGGLQESATTVDEIEELTGYDFFSSLPDSIEDAIESKADFPFWSTIKPKRKK